jgi:hypothetical protein
MDTVLLVVTVLSLATAAGLAIVVVRLVREEQRRSEARSALLAEMAADSADVLLSPPRARPAPPLRPEAPLAPARSQRPAGADLELRSPGAAVTAQDLFTTPESSSPAGGRFAVAAGLGAVVLVVFVVMSMRGVRVEPSTTHPARVPSTAPVSAPASASVPAPLELLSLRHTSQDTGLTITGVVQNPRAGAPVARIVATAFVFGPDGAFLSSARAPLDFTTLSPGEESPFVITVPVTKPIARYRVGFRTENGDVIPHVDGRGPEALARK